MAVDSNIEQKPRKPPHFVSLRWRLTFPLAIIIILMAMVGAYLLANRLASGLTISADNVLWQSSQAVAKRSVEAYTRLRSEGQRIAVSAGIAEAMRTGQAASLHQSLEAQARAAGLDSIIVTDSTGSEITGVLRVRNSDPITYEPSTQNDLSSTAPVRAYLNDGQIGAAGLMQTTQGLLVYVSIPVQLNDELLGLVLVGQEMSSLMTRLNVSGVSQLALYDSDGHALQTTIDLNTEMLSTLDIASPLITQVLEGGQPVSSALDIANTPYRAAYMPFTFGENTLGIMGTLLADNVAFVTQIGRQVAALFAAIVAGSAVIGIYVGISRLTGRMEQITTTAKALAEGASAARTGFKAVDEVGAIGQALDTYADVAQKREDTFRTMLWRQRRERNYLMAVLEALPDGVLVQDEKGRVVLMNDHARALLSAQPDFQHQWQGLEQRIPQLLGPALAPGIYALGDPQQIAHQGQVLSAQAAAILTPAGQRIGTVLLIRDITSEVQQEQARDRMLTQLSQDIQQPLASLAQSSAQDTGRMTNHFAREIARHTAALQKMIVDMRELTRYNPHQAQQKQRPLLTETLLLAVANDWRQIAQAANLDMRLIFDKKGVFILGDEARLRWAIGNIVDNAIKYTPAGGALTLEIRDVIDGRVHLRVRDNGVGISRTDLDHIFVPFYRGTPTTADGQVIKVPGIGQGLALARQVIEAHGGLMKVKSKLGVGTAVYFALPVTSGSSYALPLLDEDVMEGETLRIAEDAEIDSGWQK